MNLAFKRQITFFKVLKSRGTKMRMYSFTIVGEVIT